MRKVKMRYFFSTDCDIFRHFTIRFLRFYQVVALTYTIKMNLENKIKENKTSICMFKNQNS